MSLMDQSRLFAGDLHNSEEYKIYITMYELLDSIYAEHPDENLVVALSDLNPHIWADRMPADPAAWDEICAFYQEAKNAYSTQFDAAYYTCIRYLRQYEEEWDYPIPYAMEAFTREKFLEYYSLKNL